MIVCSCNVISDSAIRACIENGEACPNDLAGLYACLGCKPECGRCARTVLSVMRASAQNITLPIAAE